MLQKRKVTDKVIIHCSATPTGRDVGVKEITVWHIKRGWVGIGYHFVIRINGKVEKGRPIDTIGAHCIGLNTTSIGICLVGGIDPITKKSVPDYTEIQMQSLAKLITSIKKRYPLVTVHGHNEFAKKDCPCFDVSKL